MRTKIPSFNDTLQQIGQPKAKQPIIAKYPVDLDVWIREQAKKAGSELSDVLVACVRFAKNAHEMEESL